MSNDKRPLAIRQAEPVGESAFAGDLLERRKLALQLTQYLDQLKVGAVLAIDAPWGEGKSWFGQNWAKLLAEAPHNHKVVCINAFAQDYLEDPFLLLAAEIAELLDDGKETAQAFREKAAGVMKTLLPVGTKALINLAGRVVLGAGSLSDDFGDAAKSVMDGTADATGKWMEKKLAGYLDEKKSLEFFREELAKFAAAQDKPVVVFVDELDRCRPSFAVQLIERIKHLFDVPNLIFILLLNREQLEKAIKGVYGAETDASAYLGKFVHLFLRLPKGGERASDYHRNFVADVVNRYGFGDSRRDAVSNLVHVLADWVAPANLSLRDIERACALIVMSNALEKRGMEFLVYVVVLKIKYPGLYERLVRNEEAAHREAIGLLAKQYSPDIPPNEIQWPKLYFKMLHEIHLRYLSAGAGVSTPCLDKYGVQFLPLGDGEKYFSWAFNKIDLPVEDY